MINCLMLTSTDTPNMPSEAQEVINILNGHGYSVQLLQTNVTSLELYRALQRGPYPLVWIASHSDQHGFMFGTSVIAPTELAQFLEEARADDLVLNSCFSSDHVTQIQSICKVNVLATITQVIDDKLAWSSALYLASAVSRTNDLYEAYRTILSGTGSPYRWFPRSKMRNQVPENNLDRAEKSLENVMRILHGDPYIHAAGIVDLVSNLQSILREHIETSEQWKRETEIRIRVLEATSPGNTLVLTRQTVRLLLISFIVSTGLIILLVYLLRG